MNTDRIPTSMGTQHPDSASRYVPIQEEADEAVGAMLRPPEGLGVEEFMIDFEGKMTPYHQTAEVAHKLLAHGLVPGRDIWITPRVSSATEETVFRQLMALMSIIEADYDLLRSAGVESAIQEVILPMSRGADDLLALRRRIADLIDLAHKEFGMTKDPDSLQLVPLVEDVPTMLRFGAFYRDYHDGCRRHGFGVRRLRFMMGRSDSALTYGLVASVLAIKVMLAQGYRLGDELGLEVAPILGGGALPFRGHVTTENLPALLRDFPGLRTITIQSGVRYDYGPEDARHLASMLREALPGSAPKLPAPAEEAWLKETLALFALHYRRLFTEIAELAATLSDIMPRQRDRLTRRGPTGYARAGGDTVDLLPFVADPALQRRLKRLPPLPADLPRAITFTAALYSVGMPPEFLGTGGALQALADREGPDGPKRLLKDYPGLTTDLRFAGRFLSLDVAGRFFPPRLIKEFRREVTLAEEHLGVPLFGETDPAYQTLLQIIEPLLRQALRGEPLSDEDQVLLKSCMVRLGKLRGSLG